MEPTSAQYFTLDGVCIITAPAEKIYLSLLGGKTLRQVGAYGINGTFFDMAHPERPESCWGIAINRGKPLGPNATKNYWDGTRRATLIYGERRLSVERIANIDEVKRKVDWAIGGVGLFPSYDPILEKVTADILHMTGHSFIGFKGGIVYLMAVQLASMAKILGVVKRLGLEGAVLLDGGESTQLLWKNGIGIHSTRKLNNMIGVMK